MPSQPPLTVTASTTSAINRQVLKVSSDLSLAEVVGQMSSKSDGARTSCAVIVDASESVIGILTERDIVSLTAAQSGESCSFTDIAVSAVMTSPVKTLEIESFQDIFAVLFLFRRYRIRHLPIVDSLGKLVGIVTPASIRQVLKPANLLKLRRVADIMTEKVVTAAADVPVILLAHLMVAHRVSCVVIVDTPAIEEDGELAIASPIGIVTERDMVQFQALELQLHQLTAREVMSAPLFLLDPQDSLWAAHEAMQLRKVRRLVVSWNWGKGLGIITQTSLLKAFDPIEMCSIIDSLQQTIDQLTLEAGSDRNAIASMPGAVPSLSEASLSEASLSEASLSEAEPKPSLKTLLTEAIASVECASQSPELDLFQRPQLQQAKQLIQQVSSTVPEQDEFPTEPNLELL